MYPFIHCKLRSRQNCSATATVIYNVSSCGGSRVLVTTEVFQTRGVHRDGDGGNPAESAGFPLGMGMNVAGIPQGWI